MIQMIVILDPPLSTVNSKSPIPATPSVALALCKQYHNLSRAHRDREVDRNRGDTSAAPDDAAAMKIAQAERTDKRQDRRNSKRSRSRSRPKEITQGEPRGPGATGKEGVRRRRGEVGSKTTLSSGRYRFADKHRIDLHKTLKPREMPRGRRRR